MAFFFFFFSFKSSKTQADFTDWMWFRNGFQLCFVYMWAENNVWNNDGILYTDNNYDVDDDNDSNDRIINIFINDSINENDSD